MRARGDLRLDYDHSGLAEVLVSGGGRPPLLLLLADTAPPSSSGLRRRGPVPRSSRAPTWSARARTIGSTLALTGDTSDAGPITVWAAPRVTSPDLERAAVATTAAPTGRARALAGPARPRSRSRR